ncbi:hypothetical protein SAICODRAFT_17172 [Saitoella complicata NRRL Y-17804]|uniref:uncharacterized protein n=1 Tax=Saitoella complicata (strain BCRC 22490 / CBS 7301 / JCM 7358 / NBRC 10748 / NRRL Y-17804) TaxID=698492 RepID=UPI0008670322|nr:uncharacterized protein SAICODRAFT_17172 [Saitoella complicata NRRL Y-17804]ODQ55419.1 hypothetical protein SAICODRAFT_17172 [Saitoella complicata NRRL Y-17804]
MTSDRPGSSNPDVNSFLEKWKEFNDEQTKEDLERSRRLEEQIAAEKRARMERRAARTRSLSPDKGRTTRNIIGTIVEDESSETTRGRSIENTMAKLTGGPAATNTQPKSPEVKAAYRRTMPALAPPTSSSSSVEPTKAPLRSTDAPKSPDNASKPTNRGRAADVLSARTPDFFRQSRTNTLGMRKSPVPEFAAGNTESVGAGVASVLRGREGAGRVGMALPGLSDLKPKKEEAVPQERISRNGLGRSVKRETWIKDEEPKAEKVQETPKSTPQKPIIAAKKPVFSPTSAPSTSDEPQPEPADSAVSAASVSSLTSSVASSTMYKMPLSGLASSESKNPSASCPGTGSSTSTTPTITAAPSSPVARSSPFARSNSRSPERTRSRGSAPNSPSRERMALGSVPSSPSRERIESGVSLPWMMPDRPSSPLKTDSAFSPRVSSTEATSLSEPVKRTSSLIAPLKVKEEEAQVNRTTSLNSPERQRSPTRITTSLSAPEPKASTPEIKKWTPAAARATWFDKALQSPTKADKREALGLGIGGMKPSPSIREKPVAMGSPKPVPAPKEVPKMGLLGGSARSLKAGVKESSKPTLAKKPIVSPRQTVREAPPKLPDLGLSAAPALPSFSFEESEKADAIACLPQPKVAPVFGGVAKKSSLADRFNPALAGMLAKPGINPMMGGHALKKAATAPAEMVHEPKSEKDETTSGELKHMTKGRARGPKRRAPTKAKSVPEPEPEAAENTLKPARSQNLRAASPPACAQLGVPARKEQSDTANTAVLMSAWQEALNKETEKRARGSVMAIWEQRNENKEERPEVQVTPGRKDATIVTPKPSLPTSERKPVVARKPSFPSPEQNRPFISSKPTVGKIAFNPVQAEERKVAMKTVGCASIAERPPVADFAKQMEVKLGSPSRSPSTKSENEKAPVPGLAKRVPVSQLAKQMEVLPGEDKGEQEESKPVGPRGPRGLPPVAIMPISNIEVDRPVERPVEKTEEPKLEEKAKEALEEPAVKPVEREQERDVQQQSAPAPAPAPTPTWKPVPAPVKVIEKEKQAAPASPKLVAPLSPTKTQISRFESAVPLSPSSSVPQSPTRTELNRFKVASGSVKSVAERWAQATSPTPVERGRPEPIALPTRERSLSPKKREPEAPVKLERLATSAETEDKTVATVSQPKPEVVVAPKPILAAKPDLSPKKVEMPAKTKVDEKIVAPAPAAEEKPAIVAPKPAMTPPSPQKIISSSPRSRSASPTKMPKTSSYKNISGFLRGWSAKPSVSRIDVAPIHANKPVDVNESKERLLAQGWVIENGRSVSIPLEEQHVLFENDLMVYLYVYKDESDEEKSTVFVWTGRGFDGNQANGRSFADRVAREHGAEVVSIFQAKEPGSFLRALGGVMVTRRGPRKRYDAGDSFMCIVRRVFGGVACEQVDLHGSQLSSGYAFVISVIGQVFVWQGAGAHLDEVNAARKIAQEAAQDNTIVDVREGAEPDVFLDALGGGAKYASASFWAKKPDHENYMVRLYTIELGNANEIFPFDQSDLRPDNVHVIDGFFEMYVIVGRDARGKHEDIQLACDFAKDYTKHAFRADGRPFMPVATVLYPPSSVPRELRINIRGWKDETSPLVFSGQAASLQRKTSLRMRILPLDSAVATLKKETFPIKELKGDDLPLGVDADRVEDWLNEEDFQSVMGMKRDGYNALGDGERKRVRKEGLEMMRQFNF